MKTNTVGAVVLTSCVWAGMAAPADAVVTDNFEGYTVGQPANVANPTVYTPISSLPIGVIGTGTATANVPSSNVLEQVAGSTTTGTRVDGPDITGTSVITFDFRVASGTHNVYLLDNTTGAQATLIRFIEAGIGAPTQFFFQVQGGTTNSVFDAFGDYGDWYRATINLNVNPVTPTASSFAVTFRNLTDAVDVVAFAGSGADLTQDDVVRINRLQLESPSGAAQFDNLVVPEPASLALLGLGGVLMGRRGQRPGR